MDTEFKKKFQQMEKKIEIIKKEKSEFEVENNILRHQHSEIIKQNRQ